jgi:hypothetical protein
MVYLDISLPKKRKNDATAKNQDLFKIKNASLKSKKGSLRGTGSDRRLALLEATHSGKKSRGRREAQSQQRARCREKEHYTAKVELQATAKAKAKAKAKRTIACEATAEGIAETVAAESECSELERRPNAHAARSARKSQLQSTGCFNCGRLVHSKQ